MPSLQRATPIPASQHPSSAVLCVSADIRIAATPKRCFAVLRDTRHWPSWNTFCPKVEVNQPASSKSKNEVEVREPTRLRNGTAITMQCRMDASSPESLTETKLLVTTCSEDTEAPFSITWSATGMPRFALRTERTNAFTAESWEAEDQDAHTTGGKRVVQGCRYRTIETMSGPLAHVVKRMYGERLQEAFEMWAEDLAGWAENEAIGRKDTS